MQDKKLESLSLDKILSKCNPEDGLEKDDQPLYIDLETESVKCRWCSLFKGSIEPRVINQHVKSSKTHLKERRHHLHPEELTNPVEGVQDIRTFFSLAN